MGWKRLNSDYPSALQRRLLMLAPIRARIDAGETQGGRLDVNGQVAVLEGQADGGKHAEHVGPDGPVRVSERAGSLERRLMRGDARLRAKRWARSWWRSPGRRASDPGLGR